MSGLHVPALNAAHASIQSISQGLVSENKASPLTAVHTNYVNSSKVLMAAEEQERARINGVLVVNIKCCNNLKYNTKFHSRDVNIYLRISTRGMFKRTKVSSANGGNPVWNDIKHFPLALLSNPKHPFNLIRFEVVGFCSKNISDHKVIGSVAFHAHDIVKSSPAIDNFDLFDQHEAVGTVDLELAFAYGVFGYGYSDQLKEEGRAPEELLTHSLFPRIMPSPERRDVTSNLLLPMTVAHPSFIPFNSKVKIGYGKDFARMVQKLQEDTFYPEEMMRSMTKFRSLKDHLNGLTDRMDRLNFLRNEILSVQKSSEATPINPKYDMTSPSHGPKSYSRFVRPAKMGDTENSYHLDRASSVLGDMCVYDKPQPISERSSEKSNSQVNIWSSRVENEVHNEGDVPPIVDLRLSVSNNEEEKADADTDSYNNVSTTDMNARDDEAAVEAKLSSSDSICDPENISLPRVGDDGKVDEPEDFEHNAEEASRPGTAEKNT
eukprot:Nk52_evm6s2462 gene=Nk52_evmTU6s2462